MSCLKCRHVLCIFCFFGLANVYLLRINLSVAIVAMTAEENVENKTISHDCPSPLQDNGDRVQHSRGKGEFNWNKYDQGLILGSFFYGYTVGNAFGGRISERFGGKLVFGLGLLITSVLTLFTPLAAKSSTTAMVVLRALEGLSEGVAFPSIHTLCSKWIPSDERGTAFSNLHAGAEFGTVIGFPIAGVLTHSTFLGGWPAVFYLFGAAGVIWFMLWQVFIFESPSVHPRISAEEKDYILKNIAHEAIMQPKVPWLKVVTSVPVWAAALAWFFSSWIFQIAMTELPTFLDNMLHFKLETNGLVSSLPHLANMAVQSVGGIMTDTLTKRKIAGATNARKAVHLIFSLILGAFFVGVCLSQCNSAAVVACFAIAAGSQGSLVGSVGVSILDIAPDYAGTLMGLVNAFGNIPGFLMPLLTGYLLNKEDSLRQWHKLFYIAGAIAVLGSLIYAVFGTSELQPWAQSRGSTPIHKTVQDPQTPLTRRSSSCSATADSTGKSLSVLSSVSRENQKSQCHQMKKLGNVFSMRSYGVYEISTKVS